MSQIFPQNLVTFGAGKFSLGKNISTFEEYIPLDVNLLRRQIYFIQSYVLGQELLAWQLSIILCPVCNSIPLCVLQTGFFHRSRLLFKLKRPTHP